VIGFIALSNTSNVDLNLLLVLHTVLEEQNLTRAARRLQLTPSALSSALARLRSIFGDELVVQKARKLSLTPRAVALGPELVALLEHAVRVLDKPASFDPEATTREFGLACADYYCAILVPRLVARLRARAPQATLRVRSLDELAAGHGLERDVDVQVGIPPSLPNGCRSSVLFEDRFVCLVRADAVKPKTRRLSMRAFLEASHVRISVLGRMRDPVDTLLEGQGLTRSVALVVPYFSVAPLVVHETGLLATMSLRLAEVHARHLSLRLLEPPLELINYGVHMIWHERTDADEGARFFRELVHEVMNEA
jgi:DNA-binding transcriptional LysR family regulator